MFGIDSGELLIIAVIALVVIGPKDLPRAMRTIGNIVARARGMARHFRSGVDAMIREAELEEMEQKWKSENARIMREYPISEPQAATAESDWGLSAPPATPPAIQAATSTENPPLVSGSRPVSAGAPPIPDLDRSPAAGAIQKGPPPPPGPAGGTEDGSGR